jgi:hypothetical protein
MASLLHTLIEEVTKPIKHQPGSETTRVMSTAHSYKRVAQFLLGILPKNAKVIDYGSGHGHGTQIIQSIIGANATVDSYEPHPENAKHSPTYHDYSEITGPYDAVVCLNVLNVLSPDLRYEVTEHIGHIIRPGGYAVISARGWNKDVSLIKNVEPGDEPRSVWVLKKKKGQTQTTRTYQKGFDGNELKEYVSGVLGDTYEVNMLSRNNKIGQTSVLVKRLPSKKKSK